MSSLTRLAALIDNSQLNLPQGNLTNNSVQNFLQIVFGFGGGLALLVIVVAGLRYVLSQGDPGGVAKSRSAIIYAVIGLVVCAIAFSIVTFVLDRL